MRFEPPLLDEIRSRIPISEIVGRRVKLKRSGKRYSGLCPFHQEKTPSFSCDDARGTFKCFGCGKGGDIFAFSMETEGLSFPEAVEKLAALAGVDLPRPDPRAAEREEHRANLHDIMEEACRYFEASLARSAGEGARSYLARRGISNDLVAEFRLGYASNERNGLREHLARRGIPVADMIAAGLLVSGDDVPVAFDRFRNRIMFPIEDSKGRVVAFGGRALSAAAPAKYLNSPETALFHKGAMLYNAHRARVAARERGRVVAVEGYVDVVACFGVGIREAVAPLGTALTEEQLAALWRMADEPILCFDGDKAGRRAADRALDLALPHLAPDRSLRFALLPEGSDPDDVVRGGGAEAFESVLAAAEPLAERLWARECDSGPLATPERRAALEAKLQSLIATIRHEAVRRHYSEAMRERLQRLFFRTAAPGSRRPRRGRGGRPPELRAYEPAASLATESLKRVGFLSRAIGLSPREATIVGTLLNHPGLIEEHAEEIAALDLGSRELDSIKTRILEVALGESRGHRSLREQLAEDGFAPLIERIDDTIRLRGIWQAKSEASPADAEIGWRQLVHLQKKARTLHRELKDAEAAFARDMDERTLARVNQVREELLRVDGEEALIEGFGAASGRPVKTF